MSLNKVMLIGNVGKDPEVRHLESGVVTASFTLATTERYRDRNGEMKDQTEWHNIVTWRNLAEIVEKYVRKGSQVYIKENQTFFNDKDGVTKYITEIVADSLQMLGRKSDNPQSSYPSHTSVPNNSSSYSQPSPVQTPQAAPATPVIDAEDGADDLPF